MSFLGVHWPSSKRKPLRFPPPLIGFSWTLVLPPSALQKNVYYEDELCVVIYDGFPKAKHHLLIIAKVKEGSALPFGFH